MSLSAPDFTYISDLARKHAAIVLEPGKEYLVESRLIPIARDEGFPQLENFIAKLRTSNGTLSPAHLKVIDALTTNETYFFRDLHPFDALRTEILPNLIARRAEKKSLTIWCGAASTGQEPYSLAMLIRQHFPQLASWKITFIATDLSQRVLDQAKAGQYNQVEVNRGLPAIYLVKFFTKQEDRWIVKEEVRKMIEFRPLNLIGPWMGLPICDLIFIRNVLIYFDVPTKQGILKNVRAQLAPDGYFFLGTAETTLNLDPAFAPVTYGKATAYRTQATPR